MRAEACRTSTIAETVARWAETVLGRIIRFPFVPGTGNSTGNLKTKIDFDIIMDNLIILCHAGRYNPLWGTRTSTDPPHTLNVTVYKRSLTRDHSGAIPVSIILQLAYFRSFSTSYIIILLINIKYLKHTVTWGYGLQYRVSSYSKR